jgi:hypothetical protein
VPFLKRCGPAFMPRLLPFRLALVVRFMQWFRDRHTPRPRYFPVIITWTRAIETQSDRWCPKYSVAELDLPAGKKEHVEWNDELPGFGVRLRKSKRGVHRRTDCQLASRRPARQRVLVMRSAMRRRDDILPRRFYSEFRCRILGHFRTSGGFAHHPLGTRQLPWDQRPALPNSDDLGGIESSDPSAAGRVASTSAFTVAVAAGSAWSGLRAGSHAEVIPLRSGRR